MDNMKYLKKELSRDEVFNLLSIYHNWRNGPDPRNNYPIELELLEKDLENNTFKVFFGVFLHIYLSIFCKISIVLNLHKLAFWITEKRLKFNHLSVCHYACSLTNVYTDLGIMYLRRNKIEKATECLNKSWRVYPCPHNTSFGFPTRLSRLLSAYPTAENSVEEFLEMRKIFQSV
ncbi:MAG: hypothetical protein C4518_20315 [Desulfobacteraceae bacterium]|nr:MAG: hypothetical protein C4518_20315 [Desulfobacteraceae bacterium]